MALDEFHGYENSVRWRLLPTGVEVEGSGVERTRGQPVTATRVWDSYGEEISRAARAWRVPCALIVATICTESRGDPNAVRLEPGYVSDEATPGRISPGLMQTLISTARKTLGKSIDREWLLVPGNSIEAGTAYIASQARETGLDPPLVAAAYNHGRVSCDKSTMNRWRLVQTRGHVDRFVQFYNDAVFVMAQAARKPSVAHDSAVTSQLRPRSSTVAKVRNDREVAIRFGKNARPADVTDYSRGVLEDILRAANIQAALVSSTARSPAGQARVMYDNLERYGVDAQKRLYADAGDRVIDEYVRSKAAGKTKRQILYDMEMRIRLIGPTKVSRHASDAHVLNVFDLAPSSVDRHDQFEHAVKDDRRVTTFLTPPADPGYHLEIPQPAK